MAKLISYARISSETQRENTSLEQQSLRIAAYCLSQGHEIVEQLEDVESASGKKKRPSFEKALAMVYAGQADGIICMKLDRFARSTVEGLRIAAELKKRGKQLVILDLNLDTSTAIGECVFTVLLAFAQLERQTITERCTTGASAKKSQGGYAGGHPPYGWKTESKCLVKDPFQQKWRSCIFEWYESGVSIHEIARRLNEKHQVPAKRGGKWDRNSIRQLLRRPLKLESLLGINNAEAAS